MKKLITLVVLFTLLVINIPVFAEEQNTTLTEDHCYNAISILIDNRWLLVEKEDVEQDYFAFISPAVWGTFSQDDKLSLAACVRNVYNAEKKVYIVNLDGPGTVEDVYAVCDGVSCKVYQ